MDSWAVVKLLSSNRKLAFTSISRSDWHTSKREVHNRPSNKSDLRLHHDWLASSWPWHAIRKSIGKNSGPRTMTTARRRDTLAIDLRLTCDALRPISDRPTTWARPPRITCVIRQRFAWDQNFKCDLRPINDRDEPHTRQPSEPRPTYKDLRPKEDPAASLVTRKWNWQVPRPFLTVKSDRGACRLQWPVGFSYCEYPGVTYDLLLSSIVGTYHLAEQLPSNREFRLFLVVSQSQVPREVGVNLA